MFRCCYCRWATCHTNLLIEVMDNTVDCNRIQNHFHRMDLWSNGNVGNLNVDTSFGNYPDKKAAVVCSRHTLHRTMDDTVVAFYSHKKHFECCARIDMVIKCGHLFCMDNVHNGFAFFLFSDTHSLYFDVNVKHINFFLINPI